MFWVMTVVLEGELNTKCNTHANSCVLGKNAHIFLDHEHPISMFGYDKSKAIQHNDLQTVPGALTYGDTITGATIFLIVHQATYVPMMANKRLCPMQV